MRQMDKYQIFSAPPVELGERTRIDTDTDQFLVRETPEEILAMGTQESPPPRCEEQQQL